MKKFIPVIFLLFIYPLFPSEAREVDKRTRLAISPTNNNYKKNGFDNTQYYAERSFEHNKHFTRNTWPELQSPFPESGDTMYVFAGNDTTICLTADSIEVSGFAENYYYISWVYTGDGFFYDPTKLNTAYVPGAGDIEAGFATVYLVAISAPPEYIRIVDSLTITIIPEPQCFAGTNTSICQGENYSLQGQASSFAELIWTTSGDGTFDAPNILSPTYTPGQLDLENDQILLSLTATEYSPCMQPCSNSMYLSIEKSPFVFAGRDTIICENNNLQLNAVALNYDEILWISTGDGTFSCCFETNPVYYPGAIDIIEDSVSLSVILSPNLPCIYNVSDDILLEIKSPPIVTVGSDQTICDDSAIQCTASAEGYIDLQWYALGGNGTFDAPNNLNPVYTPGDYEKSTGNFFIMLAALPYEPCNIFVQDYFQITIIKPVNVNAGEDNTICQPEPALLSGQVSNYNDLFWSSNGDGTFNNSGILSPVYYPGNEDIQNGNATLFLTASSISPCSGYVSDTVILSIITPATANAGSDRISCSEVNLTGIAENYSAGFWATFGDGTFSNQYELNSIYFAGETDIENLNVILTLNVGSINPCSSIISDSITINFDKPQVVLQITPNQELFVGNQLDLHFEASSVSSGNYQWYFNNSPIENNNSGNFYLDNVQPANAGSYYCSFTNDCFGVSSDTTVVIIYEEFTQIVSMNIGWNAISSFVSPPETDMQLVLNPIVDNLIILYNNDGVYWPGQEVMTFHSWTPNTGYILKTTESDNLIISGFIRYPLESFIAVPGWSLLPVSYNCTYSVGEFFENYSEIVIVKEVGGVELFWLEKGINTLEYLNPGKAYEIFNVSDNEILISFPGCDGE